MHAVSSVEEYVDGTPAVAGIFLKDTEDEAVSEFHYKMWAAMNSENVRAITATVQDMYGRVMRSERWERITEQGEAIGD